MEFKKFDDASWHYEGDYPEELAQENSGTHIGMFLTWCIRHKLLSEELMEDAAEEIIEVENKEITGAQFLWRVMDGKFTSDDVSEEIVPFIDDYYEDGKKFSYNYYEDYITVVEKNKKYESIYHVEDSWENYEVIGKIISNRYDQWKKCHV